MIRDESLRRFAARGPEPATVRQTAEAAGASAGLVLHHFNSKDGLRQQVDEYVLAVFEATLGELTGQGGAELRNSGTGAGSLSEAFAVIAATPPAGTPPRSTARIHPARIQEPSPKARWVVRPARSAAARSAALAPLKITSISANGRVWRMPNKV
ncbi:helix-turn-helix domain-containing protein [Streptomyces sp. NPDC088357]|uniref:TetR/AcrR family transcriptional regulator n=1 Tax=Streptomyces sp. NPDC088357 TaxID=3154655 RepID=UPI00343CD2EB